MTNLTINTALLYYEDSNGKVSTLLLNYSRYQDDQSWRSTNITSHIESQSQGVWGDPGLMLESPFTTWAQSYNPSTAAQSFISLAFYFERNATVLDQLFNVSTISTGNFTDGRHCASSSSGPLFIS